MASGTLYAYNGSLKAAKVQIAAEYSGFKLNQGSFEYGKTNTSSEFLKKFPLGKVPAFESNEGQCLYETDAICYFVSNSQLKGNSAIDQALVQQYMAFSNNEITPSACTWTFPCLGFKQYNKADTTAAQEHLKKVFTMLNDTLLTRTFLVGERVTLADITLCCDLVCLYKLVLDPKFRAPFGNLNRWFMTCINQPQFKKILGEVKLAETMAQFDNKKYQEFHPKGGNKKDDKKQEKKTEKKQDKSDKPDPKGAAAAAAAKPAKKVNPFTLLPQSPLILDEWKKMYSNNEIGVSMPWFWDWIKDDKDNWSFWHGTYNFSNEIKVPFMARNGFRGFDSRIEGMRKYGMGTFVIFVNEDAPQPEKFKSEAIFMFRGQEQPFTLDDDWNTDAEHWTWKKLEPFNNQKEKDMIAGYWSCETFDERTVDDSYHIFK